MVGEWNFKEIGIPLKPRRRQRRRVSLKPPPPSIVSDICHSTALWHSLSSVFFPWKIACQLFLYSLASAMPCRVLCLAVLSASPTIFLCGWKTQGFVCVVLKWIIFLASDDAMVVRFKIEKFIKKYVKEIIHKASSLL